MKNQQKKTVLCGVVVAALAIFAQTVLAAPSLHPGVSAKTPLSAAQIDSSVFREALDGTITDLSTSKARAVNVLWTDDPGQRAGYPGGLAFGREKIPGPRHLQIGMTESIPVGSVLTLGNIVVSVLKETSAAPGDPLAEEQWTVGQRLLNGQVSSKQAESDEIALWVFPAGTSTRSLRFTHTAQASDTTYEGWLGGAMILSERLKNLAPQAQASSASNNGHAPKIINGKLGDVWKSWANVDSSSPGVENLPPVTAARPEDLLLVWPKPVPIDELFTVWTGFGSIDIQAYSGPNDQHPRDATDDAWQTVVTVQGLECGYPSIFGSYRLSLGKTVTTRALRLRLTSPSPVRHPHVMKSTVDGRRVWLGQVLAATVLKADALTDVNLVPDMEATRHPPIPVRFKLKKAGYVTLVIEDERGKRVRNLVSETWFPAGRNIAWWDGTHDLDRDLDAARHGLYRIPAKFVEPGTYRARGLTRDKITPVYEMSVINSGHPPWSTPDHTGAWLANHSPPQAALAVPAAFSPTGEDCVFLGCEVTEGPDGFAWVDLDGRKRGGKKWIGGIWTSAPFMARDMSPKAPTDVPAYVASTWETAKSPGLYELRITALKKGAEGGLSADQPVCNLILNPDEDGNLPKDHQSQAQEKRRRAEANRLGGMAVYAGRSAVSFPARNKLLIIDNSNGKLLEEISLTDPRGMVCTENGELLVLSGSALRRYDFTRDKLATQTPASVMTAGLDDPVALALDDRGNFYISDRGSSHQVKVFSVEGKFLRAIGNPGAPAAGPYDKLHMNNPAGLAIDSRNQLWVTEQDLLPKRVSVWTLDGQFIRATYGPGKYGGGGTLDSTTGDRFYYTEGKHGTLEYNIDWKSGQAELLSVPYRESEDSLELPFAAPESVIVHDGKRYMSNSYNSSPTSGHTSAFLFQMRDDIAYPLAGMGLANLWPLLKTEPFLANWPQGVDLAATDLWGGQGKHDCLFIWSDLNLDGHVQPEEVSIHQTTVGGVTIADDLSFCFSRTGASYRGAANHTALRLRPVSVDGRGIPQYRYEKREVVAEGVYPAESSGGAQLLVDASDESIVTLGVEPFHQYSICGMKNGQATWSYPNPWPGLHASHHAAKPDRPGQMIGATRLLGGFVQPKGSRVKPLWAINSNLGNFFLFTRDGLFVATVFEDMRQGRFWNMPVAERGMLLDGITLRDENFWPSIGLSREGKVMIVDGVHSSLVRLDGLESLQPIDPIKVKVTTDDLARSQEYVLDQEAARQKQAGSGLLTARLGGSAPIVDGNLDDWNDASWVEIDKSGYSAKPYHYHGALAVVGETLYAAWDTRDGKLLRNSGEVPNAIFKTGAALDIMLATDATAPADRRAAAKGDLRLLVTMVGTEPKATLYQQVVPGTLADQKIPFSSPWRTVTFDEVTDVSSAVKLAADGKGGYEVAVPLALLGFTPADGMITQGDMGILRGNGSETTARVYWSNKATAITADVPSEAQLAPNLWGRIRWKKSEQ